MKQFDPITKKIGSSVFYIRPLPAFKAAMVSGMVTSTFGPAIGNLLSLLDGGAEEAGEDKDIADIDLTQHADALASAFSTIDGYAIEKLAKELLVNHSCIGVSTDGISPAEPLTEDLANEVFAGETQNLFILMFYAVEVNYHGFFEKVKTLFGSVTEKLKAQVTANTAD